jgi:hypothetical protein
MTALSAASYLERTQTVKELDLKALHIEGAFERLAQRLWKGYAFCLKNKSQKAVDVYARQIAQEYARQMEKNGYPAESARVYTLLDLSYWTFVEGKAEQTSSVQHAIYQRVSGSQDIQCRSPSPTELSKWDPDNPIFVLASYKPMENPPGYDVIKFFVEVMEAIAPFLSTKDLLSIEWRYEAIHLYQKEVVDVVLEELQRKGFCVTIKEPYVIVEKEMDGSGRFYIHMRQPICVSIPPESQCVPEAKQERLPWMKKTLSLNTILVACKEGSDKFETLRPSAYLSIQQVLESISEELSLVASSEPCVKRYAFPVHNLADDDQEKLLQELALLGYTATLDLPFIYERFVCYHTGIKKPLYKQYVLIDLP